MSQRELAEAMTERGWKWLQQTVGMVERGERSVKLAEAIDLVKVLGLRGIHDLTADPGVAEAVDAFDRARAAAEALYFSAKELQDAQYELVSLISYLMDETNEDLPLDDKALQLALSWDPVGCVRTAYPKDPGVTADEADNPWVRRLLEGPYGRRLQELRAKSETQNGEYPAAPGR